MTVRKLRSGLDRALEAALAVLMSAMVINVLWQVCTRFLLGDPSSVTEEIARFALIWLGMLGASYGFGRKVHLSVGLAEELLAKRVKKGHPLRIALALTSAAWVSAFAVSILLVGGAKLVSMTLRLEQTSAALGVPLGFIYAVLPISGAIILIYAGLEAVEAFGRPSGQVDET